MVNHGVSTNAQERHAINTQATNWHILGAGAMGCLWAAKIWQHAQSCVELPSSTQPACFLLRDATALAHWQRVGGVIVHSKGTQTLIRVNAVTIAEASPAAIDNLLLCTKAQDALPALQSVAHLLHAESRVVLIQNGTKAQQAIVERFPTLALFCLSTSHGAYLTGAYEVVHAGQGETYLGPMKPELVLHSAEQSRLLSSLASESMNIHWDTNITDRLWTKFAINCAINALTVIYNCRNGELLNIPAAASELHELCGEIESIMNTVAASPQPLALFSKVLAVLEATAQNYSSTLQDVRKSRPTEIAYFNAYLCELASKANRDCPLNDAVLRRFNAIARHDSD
jgi:2-dehydropantoate 2-reductase